ncbi:MAG: helix-turn-helix domain-containing protein [Candidatus Binataceae bacterium]
MAPEQLKKSRAALGCDQVALARRLGVHPMTLSRWERGFSTIPAPVEKLIRLWVNQNREAKGKR